MKEQWFNVGQKPDLKITCQGDLVIQTGTDASIVTRAQNVTVVDGVVESADDLKMLIPHGSTLDIVHVAGNLKIKGVDGAIHVADVDGDAGFGSVNGDVDIRTIKGDLKIISLGGALSVGEVSGDLVVRNAGSVSAKLIYGDANLHNINGEVNIEGVYGDMVAKSVMGNLNVANVTGDCALDNLSGTNKVSVSDDIRIGGPLAPGKHTFESGSTITLRWPSVAPLTLTATAPDIQNRLQFSEIDRDDETLSGSFGDGDCTVSLTAANRITLRPDARSESRNDWETFMDFEFDMAGFGERVSAEINARMADLTRTMGPEISTQVERAIRQAQTALDRVAERIETETEDIVNRQNRPKRGRPRANATPPPPPTAPKAESAPDVSAAQIKILKMLEDGVLSVDDANDLLASLG